jgi:hypothetical protein
MLAAGSLTSCDLDPDDTSKPRAVPSPDPDQEVLDAARAELAGLVHRLPATGRTASLAAVHREQLDALQGDPPATVRHRHPDRAWVARRERRAADRFERWALEAQNGDLARVLASICAGIRMQPELRESA